MLPCAAFNLFPTARPGDNRWGPVRAGGRGGPLEPYAGITAAGQRAPAGDALLTRHARAYRRD